MQVGDWVLIVRQSHKYNPQIKHGLEGARIDEVNEDYVQLQTINGGIGAVDRDSVKVVTEEEARRKNEPYYAGAPTFL